MSIQHLTDFMDETGFSAEDILTVLANDEIGDAEVRLAAFRSLMDIWKDEREKLREASRKMLTPEVRKAAADSLLKLAESDMPAGARVRAASMLTDLLHGNDFDQTAPEEMTLEELQAHAAKAEAFRAQMFGAMADPNPDDEGGEDADTFN